jgi:hypothetical protein
MGKKIEKPIFIFGCCNSGTTILWETLKKHKDLSGPKVEGQDLRNLPKSMKHYLGKTTFRLWAHPKFNLEYYRTEDDYNEKDKEQIIRVYKRHLKADTRFITKSPADTLRARLIQAYFPDAYFIAMVRDGYAVSQGIIKKRKHDPDRPKYKGLETTVEEAAEQWFRANTIVVSHKDYLKRYKIVKYEDLVEKTEETILSVLKFCDLDTTIHRGFEIPSFMRDMNEICWLHLTNEEADPVTRIAGPMLLHFGYDYRKCLFGDL